MAISRRSCTLTSGSSVITIPAGQKNSAAWSVGTIIFGPGIPANTFVGDSRDLTSTQIRLVDNNGVAVNATMSRTVNVNTRGVTFQNTDGIQQKAGNTTNANALEYSPLNSSDWPSTLPKTTAQAMDIQASKKLTKENVVLTGTDITNQYVDLSNLYLTGSLDVELRTALSPTVIANGHEGASYEYTVGTYVDANGLTKTRITFVTNWATGGGTALLSGDTLHVHGLTQTDSF
jgi:hypothetical protein